MSSNTHRSPRTDDDTNDVIDDALHTLAERRGPWLGDDAVIIGLLGSLIAQADRELPLAVVHARANGASWDNIAELLGTSAHEARLRFDPDSPITDRRWPFDLD
ncbi:MAG: hypothetical protein ACRD0A_03630 [Acidimicrobiales bacterium]